MIDPVRYLYARGLSVLGLSVMSTTFVISALTLKADALFLGNMGLCATIASLASSFLIGHLVDRMGHRTSLLVSQGSLVIFAAVLAGGTGTSRGGLLITVAIFSSLRSFRSISQFSVFGRLLTNVKDREKWINLSTLSWQLAFFVGPVVAGLFNSLVGARTAYVFATVGLFAGLLIQIPFLRRLAVPQSRPRSLSIRTSLTEVIRFFGVNRRMTKAFVLDFIVIVFAGASAMLPFLGGVHMSSFEIGLLRAAMPFGVISGTAWVLMRPANVSWQNGLFIATFGFALFHFGLAFSSGLAMSLALLAAAGFCDALSLSIREIILQTDTPAALRGRVYSVNNFLVNASDELSEWESGVSAHFFGIRRALMLGATITAGASLYFWRHENKGEHASPLRRPLGQAS